MEREKMKNYNELNAEEKKVIEDKLDNLITIMDKIDINKVTILTGSNGSGKSLIRSQLTFKIKEEKNKKLKHGSMELRTSTNSNWGALSSITLDTPWHPTSINTINLINGLFKAGESDKDTGYLVIDEPEIGLSEETQLAVIEYMNEKIKRIKQIVPDIGILIITHSRLFIENLIIDDFINIEGLSKDEYLNRKIVPTNLDELKANYLFFMVRDEMNKSK